MLSDFQKKNIGTAYYNDGLKAGMEKGMERGRAEGRLAVAREMLGQGLSVEKVAAYTSLPEKTVSEL